MSDILDYQAQHVLQRMISKLNSDEKYQLRNLYHCGDIITVNSSNQVHLVTNGETSEFYGHAHCQNPWCCPVCTAKRMEIYRSEIASALDMLKSEYFGFMVTFTIPHLRFMSCREVTDILYDTWKYFRLKNFNKDFHPYQQFVQDVEVKYWVRVCEYTYGEDNGWHPHFHCIFWVKRGNEHKVLDWQQKLNDFWTKTAKRVTLKYWTKNNLHANEDIVALCERLFSKTYLHDALKISTDKDGKILESFSSDYLTGWGGDRELTGNFRKGASHNGHYTPHQILNMAFTDSKWGKLYIEFCLNVTRKPVHHRVDFSKNGFKKLIVEYRKTHSCVFEITEKKTPWKVVCTFGVDAWYKICFFNRYAPVKANILYLASKDIEFLVEYLQSLDVEFRLRNEDNPEVRHVEKIFNKSD